MQTSLRILHVLRAPVGGLFRHVRDLATAQRASGHAVGIVVDATAHDRLTAERLAALAPDLALGLHRMPMARDVGLADITAVRQIARLMADIGADVAHGHGAKGGAYARLGARLARGRRPATFYTPHGGSLHYAPSSPKGRLYMGLERLLAPMTDGVCFESHYSARLFAERVSAPRLDRRVIHNGIGADELVAVLPEAGASDLLFIGELRELKGVDVLLAALARLRSSGRPARLRIVGDGPDRERFVAEAQALGVGAAVEFLGAMPARRAFALGRVLVVPSRAESLPYIVLEAIGAGLPLIATDVGGIPEIVGRSGTPLVSPGSTEALAATLAALWDDLARGGNETRERAIALRREVEAKFTIATMASEIETFYRAALTARRQQEVPVPEKSAPGLRRAG